MSDPYRQWRTAQDWVRRGDWQALQEGRRSPDPELRLAVVSALGESRAPRAIALLTECLQDADPEIQDSAAKALGRLGETAIPALTAAIGTLGEPAVLALARIPHPAIVSPLVGAWPHLSPSGRAQVLAALHPWRNAEVLALLQTALSDPAPVVQQEALIGLGLAAQQGEFTDLAQLMPFLAIPALTLPTIQALGRAGAIEALTATLAIVESEAIPAIATALATIGSEAALTVLASLIESVADPVAIVVLLARHGGARHLEVLWHQKHPCFAAPAARRELAMVSTDANLLKVLTQDPDGLVALYARHRLQAGHSM